MKTRCCALVAVLALSLLVCTGQAELSDTAGAHSSVSANRTGTTQNGTAKSEKPLMQEAVDNCADPANVDVSMSLAVDADIVITGLVVVDAGTAPVLCAPSNSTLKTLPADATPSDTSGPDLLLDMRKNSSGSSKDGTTLLVAVQCVHKGALACRRNSADLSALADAAGRCVVAVKIPSQTTKSSCLAYPGYRYMFLLSSKAAAKCDGAYSLAHSAIKESIRPHLSTGGADVCPPYPSWPAQSTKVDGGGLAGLISKQCPGAAVQKTEECAEACKNQTCRAGSGITCVAKACEGRFMLQDSITPVGACAPVFISEVTGLPVAGCNVTDMQLVRQHRQSQKRVGLLSGETPKSIDSSGNPRIVDPQSLFAGRFGTALGQALAQRRQEAGQKRNDEEKP